MSKRVVSKRVTSRRVYRWAAVLLALGLLASSCGDRDDGDADAGTTTEAPDTTDAPDTSDPDTTDPDTTEPPEADPCEGVELEATEIGVTADTIKVIVMADVDSALAPGLFDGSRLGVEAWGEEINARGGLACRQVEVEFHDSKLDPNITVEGFLKACDSALALVGTTVLFGLNTNDLTSCPDMAGAPTGVPDLSYITTEVPHQCSSTSFHLSRPGAECPWEGGDRDYTSNIAAPQWLAEELGVEFNGIYLVPSDLPSTRASAAPITAAMTEIGVTWDGLFGVSGAATQGEFGQYVTAMRDNGSNFVYNGSNDQAMLKMKREAAVQGLDVDSVTWVCSLACYTPAFVEEGGPAAEGVYVWASFLPFEEADSNEELATFMGAINSEFPAAWAAGAWGTGVLFEQAVDAIIERDGPNAITRQAIIDQLATTESFDVNGWWSPSDFTTTNTISACFMLMQVQDGEFVRVHPEAPGELECGIDTVEVTLDPEQFALDN